MRAFGFATSLLLVGLAFGCANDDDDDDDDGPTRTQTGNPATTNDAGAGDRIAECVQTCVSDAAECAAACTGGGNCQATCDTTFASCQQECEQIAQ